MSSPLLIVVLCVLSSSYGLPFLEQTVFSEFMKTANLNSNSPKKESGLAKRNTYELNSDAELKRISLAALIGNLETSLYKSALSVSNVPHDERLAIKEVKPPVTERGITKRNTEVAEGQIARNAEGVVNTKPEVTTEKILLQTTEKIPEKAGIPAHILIDRISIIPHTGGVPLIPPFRVHYSKITAGLKNENDEEKPKISNSETHDTTQSHAAGVVPKTELTHAVSSTTEASSAAAHHDGSRSVVTQHDGSSSTTAHHDGSSSIAPHHDGSSSIAPHHDGSSTIAPHHDGSSSIAPHHDVASSTVAYYEESSTKATIHDHTSSIAAVLSSTSAAHSKDVHSTASTTVGSTEHSSASTSTSTTATTTTSTSSTTTQTPPTSSTAKTPIVELKEAEEELKEKVAEIEAEPIIFSSRI